MGKAQFFPIAWKVDDARGKSVMRDSLIAGHMQPRIRYNGPYMTRYVLYRGRD